MNTTSITDESEIRSTEKPGARLAAIRAQRGYSADDVASKLHLRVTVIQLLEADEYHKLPEPVFIKGYLRAYAKLLDVPVEPVLMDFKELYRIEHKSERALWQSRRETHRAEHAVRWVTGLFAIGVLVAVVMWWQKNKDTENFFSAHTSHAENVDSKSETEIRLTDLSKMRSLLSSNTDNTTLDTSLDTTLDTTAVEKEGA